MLLPSKSSSLKSNRLILLISVRQKEFLKVKGFQVAPAELEGHLLDHSDVNDVGVVGVPDEFSGELPLAFVALQPAALDRIKSDPGEEARLKGALKKVGFPTCAIAPTLDRRPNYYSNEIERQFVSDVKTRYKWLDGGVEFVDAVPKTPSGKILVRAFTPSLPCTALTTSFLFHFSAVFCVTAPERL